MLRQLRHDKRTIALLIVVPCILVALIKYVFCGSSDVFDRIGAPLVGIFPLISMFLVTSIAMLRERTSGTLERLLSMPLAKLDLLLGYGVAFAAVAVVQAGLVCTLSLTVFGLDVAGPTWMLVLVALADALLGTALGLFVSAFAATEFQAVQFMPAFLLPQLLLCGLLTPRENMARPLEIISWAAPMTYAYDALERVSRGVGGWALVADVLVVCGFIVLALGLGASTLRRRTA